MTSKCDRCPTSGPCVGQRPRMRFACGMAERGTRAELAWIVAESGDAPPTPPPDPQPVPPTAPKADFAELRNATKLGSRNCWFAEQAAGCGCNGQWCHLLKRRINIFDCVECLRKW